MVSPTLSRPGENVNTGTNPEELFLRIFSHEVLAAMQNRTQFMGLTRSRTLRGGKSATFPVVGKGSAGWHVAAEDLITDGYLQSIGVTEKEIFADDLLLAPTLVYDLDMLKNAWDCRSEYANSLGHALGDQADQHIIATIIAAAESAANINDSHGSTGAGYVDQTTNPTSSIAATTGAHLVEFAYNVQEDFDKKNVPEEGRKMVVRPAEYYKLAQVNDMVDKDFTSGNGGKDSGRIMRVAGLEIIKTNNFLSTDTSAVADTGAKNDPFGAGGDGYNADFTKYAAFAFHKEAVGTVKMLDLAVETDRIVQRQAWLFVAKYVMGHGILRPECAAAMDVKSTP